MYRCTRLIKPSLLARSIASSSRVSFPRAPRSSASTPWFVDEDENNGPSSSSSRASTSPTTLSNSHKLSSPPPPSEAPAPLRVLHAHLLALPLLESVTVMHASALDALRGSEDPLPSRKPHGKRNRGAVSFGGDGVGDPPPAWEWVLQAQVKEGAEKRGAVEAVIRTAIKALSAEFPELPLPTKAALRNMDDGWGFLDVGNFTVHVLSKDAKKKWFSGGAKPQIARTFERWY